MPSPGSTLSQAVHGWGTTAAERARRYPCDDRLPDADVAAYRGVDVAAPPATVFRWVCQLRAAPYSYDWIDNLGRRSPGRLTGGLDALAVGQRVMTIFDLVDFEPGVQITIASRGTWRLGAVVVTYLVEPATGEGSRLLVKLLIRSPSGPVRGFVARRLLPAGDLVMMRKQLLTLKALAERAAAGGHAGHGAGVPRLR